jgi:hypothetical protein
MMSFEQVRLVFLIIVITLVSGLADSWGFIHSAKIWQAGQLLWQELGKAALGFGVGISLYWFMLKYMTQLGIVAPEIQAIFWFGVTLIGTAIISSAFLQWQWTEQVVAIGVLLGIGWLIVRTGG